MENGRKHILSQKGFGDKGLRLSLKSGALCHFLWDVELKNPPRASFLPREKSSDFQREKMRERERESVCLSLCLLSISMGSLFRF